MKNLLVLNNISEQQASKYIEYINKSGYKLEIVNGNGYSDLDKIVYNKQLNQLHNMQEYRFCFYLDDQQEEINLPETFVRPQTQNIIVFNPVSIASDNNLYSSSTKFWYCESMEFDIVSKFWKSNIHSIESYFYQQVKHFKIDDNRKYAVPFAFWLNEVIIHPNFI